MIQYMRVSDELEWLDDELRLEWWSGTSLVLLMKVVVPAGMPRVQARKLSALDCFLGILL